jgi:hypothetical protein
MAIVVDLLLLTFYKASYSFYMDPSANPIASI